jgi:hypothetical protein
MRGGRGLTRARHSQFYSDLLCITSNIFQAKSKFSQIQQNPAKPEQNQAKKRAWISLDFLRGIEPFQQVMPTPGAKKVLFVSLSSSLDLVLARA